VVPDVTSGGVTAESFSGCGFLNIVKNDAGMEWSQLGIFEKKIGNF
jgi:hypothetical protein